jgi:hypothetical protein
MPTGHHDIRAETRPTGEAPGARAVPAVGLAALASPERAHHSIMSSLGLRQARLDPAMSDDEYVAWGKSANQAEYAQPENGVLLRVLEEEESLDALLEVPFGFKHVRDLRAMMKLAVAVAGERREHLVRHSLFYPAFAAFTLGFSTALVCAHRARHGSARKLSRRQTDACLDWGVTVATFYLALVESEGIFGKQCDLELYGIEDKWRLLSDERRWLCFDHVLRCSAAGREAAQGWCGEESERVGPRFVEALETFVSAYPDREFE